MTSTNKRQDGFSAIREALQDGNKALTYLRAQQGTGGNHIRLLLPPAPGSVPVPDSLTQPEKVGPRLHHRPASARPGGAGAGSSSAGGVGGSGSGGGATAAEIALATSTLEHLQHPDHTHAEKLAAEFIRKAAYAASQALLNHRTRSGGDIAVKAWTIANKSSNRVSSTLQRLGVEPPLPIVDFSGNITVFKPRLPLVFEESTRPSQPLSHFRTTKTGNSDPILVPLMRPAPVYDVGDMGKGLTVQIAPDVIPADVGSVRIDPIDRKAKPPTAGIHVTQDEINYAISVARHSKSGGNGATSPVKPPSSHQQAHGGGGGGGRSGSSSGGNHHHGPTSSSSSSSNAASNTTNSGATVHATHEENTRLPIKLSEKILSSHHVPTVVTMSVAATHANPVYRVVNHMSQQQGGGKSGSEAPPQEDTDEDKQASVNINRIAYSSVGLVVPEKYAPGQGISAIVQQQMIAARGAASHVDKDASRRLTAELATIKPYMESRKYRLSTLVEPGLSRLRPATAAPASHTRAPMNNDDDNNNKDGSRRGSEDYDGANSKNNHHHNNKNNNENGGGRGSPSSSSPDHNKHHHHSGGVSYDRHNPFNVTRETFHRVTRKGGANVTVTGGGAVKIGSLSLEPSQAASLAEIQKTDASLGTVFAAVITNTSILSRKLAESKATFERTANATAEAANDAVEAYRYRLGFSRSHRHGAVDDVLDLKSAGAMAIADSVSEAASKAHAEGSDMAATLTAAANAARTAFETNRRTNGARGGAAGGFDANGHQSGIPSMMTMMMSSNNNAQNNNNNNNNGMHHFVFDSSQQSGRNHGGDQQQQQQSSMMMMNFDEQYADIFATLPTSATSGVPGPNASTHVNMGSAIESVAAMRLVTARELLLDEADSLDVLARVVEATTIHRVAGLTAIERIFLRLIRTAVEARTPVTRAFTYKLLENIHTFCLKLSSHDLMTRIGVSRGGAVQHPTRDEGGDKDHTDDGRRGLTPPRDDALESFEPSQRRKERWLREEEDAKEEKQKKAGKGEDAVVAGGNGKVSSGTKSTASASATATVPSLHLGKTTLHVTSTTKEATASHTNITTTSSSNSNTTTTNSNNNNPHSFRPISASANTPASITNTRRPQRDLGGGTSARGSPTASSPTSSSAHTGSNNNNNNNKVYAEPLSHLPDPLLTEAERSARAARRAWPLLLARPLSVLLEAVGISEYVEYREWLHAKNLVLPTQREILELDVQERMRGLKEVGSAV